MKAKKNAEKFPQSKALTSLKPKAGFIADLAAEDLSQASGRELGFMAHSARARSAKALLEFCSYVYVAYSRYYEPWKKVGRKGSKRLKEAKTAESHWNDFLGEIGWEDFARYQKQIRDCAAIGRRAGVLERHSPELPATVSALSTLCKSAKTDKQLEQVAKQCSPETTAAEVKQLLLPKTSTNGEQPQEVASSVDVLKCDLVLDPLSLEANAALLALIFSLEMNDEVLGEGTTIEGLGAIDSELAAAVATYMTAEPVKALVEIYDERVAQSSAIQSAKKAKQREDDETKAYVRSTMARLSPNKKRDYSKLKV